MDLSVVLIVTIGFLIFATFNFVGLYWNFKLLEEVRQDLILDLSVAQMKFIGMLETVDYGFLRKLMVIYHLLLDAIIIGLIWWRYKQVNRKLHPTSNHGGKNG